MIVLQAVLISAGCGAIMLAIMALVSLGIWLYEHRPEPKPESEADRLLRGYWEVQRIIRDTERQMKQAARDHKRRR